MWPIFSDIRHVPVFVFVKPAADHYSNDSSLIFKIYLADPAVYSLPNFFKFVCVIIKMGDFKDVHGIGIW